MTSPDGQGLPDTDNSVGGWDPLVALGALGQALIMTPLDKFLSGLLGTPAGSFDTVEELVQDLIPAIIRRVLGGLGGLLGGGSSGAGSDVDTDILGKIPVIGDLVKAAQGITTGLAGGMLSVANQFLTRWTQLNTTQGTANDALALANTAQNAVADLSTFVAAARATAAYTGNYNDMVTVPRWGLIPYITGTGSVTVSGTTGSGGTTTAAPHTHTFNDGAHSHTLTRGIPKFTPQVNKFGSPGLGTTYYTPIVVDRTGNLDKFRFITGADDSLFGIDAYYVALMVYDIPAGKFRTLWNPGDIKNSMGSSRSEVSISMGLSGAAAALTPGQILIAAHQQSAPGVLQTARSVAWVPQSGVARTNDVLLPGCYWASSSAQNGIPSEVDVSSLVSANDGIPWYAVSVLNP
ncbi:minor tail protein [Gordonia phage Morrissey]|nr:minor tail protein [Gordonia phage Morrissey]